MSTIYKNKSSVSPKKIGLICIIAAAVLLVILLISSCMTSVPTGHTGIVTTFGKVENYTLEAGMHFKFPWQKVVKMDNRNQKSTLALTCFSSDIQEVDVLYTINYQIDKENAQIIYKTIGTDYFNTVMNPRIQEAVKKTIAQYTAETLVDSRDKLSTEIYNALVTDLATYNVEVISTSIENIDFTDAFTAAVEAKQVAAQNKLRAETEQEQANMEAEAAAKRAVIAANADAETSVISAEAAAKIVEIQANSAEYQGQKDAAINKAIAASLTDELLQYFYITGWDGKLPETYVSQEEFLALLDLAAQKRTGE